VNSIYDSWSEFVRDSKLLDAWFQLPDGNKLMVLLVLSGLIVYKATKLEGFMLVPVLGGAFAVMAYAMALAMRML